jgi:CDP-glycerol glycerophosphotransferase
VPTEIRSDGAYLAAPYLEDMRLRPSKQQLRLGPADLRVIARVTSLWWHGATLRVTGHAYLTNLDYDPETAGTRIELFSSDGARVPVSVRSRRDDRIDIESGDAWHTYRESGFVVDIDPATLPVDAAGPWRAEVTVNVGDVRSATVLCDHDTRGIGGARAVPPARGRGRWMAGFEDDGTLQIRYSSERGTRVTELSSDGHSVSVTLEDPSAQMLRLRCRSLGRDVEVSGRRDRDTGKVRFDIVLPGLGGGDDLESQHIWSMQAHAGTEEPRRLTYQGGADDLVRDSPEHGRVRAVMTRAGTLRLVQNHWRPIADDVRVDGETLTVTGRISCAGATAIGGKLVGDTQTIEADEGTVDSAGETFSVRFPFNTGTTVPTTRHSFTVWLSVDLDGQRPERWLRASHELQHRLPSDADADSYGVTLGCSTKAAALRVRFRLPYLLDERGRLAQRRLHRHFRTPMADGGGALPELRDAVLFESFFGRNVSDSVLAIYHELRERDLGLEFFWSVADLSIPVPDGATPLLRGSRACMDIMHNARYLVNNASFPLYFRKRAGQTYVQTWHGTPLKRVGHDVPATSLPPSTRQLNRREASYWDVLLAQNDYAADVLREAFGYEGRILQVGYPRNDVLVDAEAPLRRKRARAELGISDDQRVVLYAPTWRDNASVASGSALVSHIDFAAARAAIGEGAVFLLRGHQKTADDLTARPTGVLDVTRHPDINDLILASDVLITDYSSIMFDYAVTGKPVVFVAPDLDEYRDVTRGFYLDLEEIAPGPIYRTSDDLISGLARSGWTDLVHAQRYRDFVERFAPRDDGAATRRVVEALWG